MDSPTFPTDDELISLSDSHTFKRALSYARSGAVEITARSALKIEALVSGNDDYSVRLLLGEQIGRSFCACPVGRFCKHLVATALVVRDGPADPELAEQPEPEVTSSDLRTFLETQPASRLAGWLEELAQADPVVERRLRIYQSLDSPKELRKALARLLRAPRFLDQRASSRFARELDVVLSLFADLGKTDRAATIGLYEYALTRLFKVFEQSDDSNGNIGARIGELLEQFLDLLKRSPELARAAPLLKLQRQDQWSILPTQAIWAVLDEQQRTEYAKAVEAEYRALPPRVSDESRFSSAHFYPVQRMEALAEVRGDLETLIVVIARDLSSGHAFERIVALLVSAGREREATQWAERGFKAHPRWRGIHPLLARQYTKAGLLREALELHWQAFQIAPERDTWMSLKEAAAEEWPAYRTRALGDIAAHERVLPDGRCDATLRARLLMGDGDLEGALDIAGQSAVAPHVLEDLGAKAADGFPEKAAALLRRAVDATLSNSQPRDYPHQVRQIASVLKLAPGPASRAWAEQIRARYRARRKFAALLDAAGIEMHCRDKDSPDYWTQIKSTEPSLLSFRSGNMTGTGCGSRLTGKSCGDCTIRVSSPIR